MSSTFFTHRMRVYLKSILPQPDFEDPFEPLTSLFTATASLSGTQNPNQGSSMSETLSTSEDMTRCQEEQFLHLFWQTYHITFPILNEKEFREHYNSLWTDAFSPIGTKRKPSALVDSMLALCLQHSTAYLTRDEADANIKEDDVNFAGRELHRRSQNLLLNEYEVPTISTLQCLIYTALYLSNASMLHMEHQILATAVGIARTLGVHHEPMVNSSTAQSSLRRRIWWTLFLLDSKACLELGRPHLINTSDMTCTLPSDDLLEAADFGSSLSLTFADINWLTFHTQSVKLIVIVRSIQTSFYEHCSEVSASHEETDLYDNPEILESCADHLLRSMKGLQDWIRDVPVALKIPRKGTGEPFSTSRSVVDLDPYVPLWLQRQRLLLELLYHNLTMSLRRPFTRFTPASNAAFQISVDHSVSCLNHAIITTDILHQVLTEVDILNGWQQAYQSQWDAALSMLGFGLAHPVCPHSPSARRAVHTAMANFATLANNNSSIAALAGAVTRNLLGKIDLHAIGFRKKSTSSDHSPPSFLSPRVSQHLRASPQTQGLQITSPQAPFPPLQNRSAITMSSPSFEGINNFPTAPAFSTSTDFSMDTFGAFEGITLPPYQDMGPSGMKMGPNWGQAAQEHNDASQMLWNMDLYSPTTSKPAW